MTAKKQKQYKKENITALAKYDDAVAKLLSLYPDRKLPTISTLEEKRKKLTSDVQQMNEEYKAIIDELKKLGGVNRFDYDGSSDYRLYFISPMTRVIGFCINDKTCAELLRDTYTEKFLPEKKELIEIDGKRYRKEDVINRIKDLKEEK